MTGIDIILIQTGATTARLRLKAIPMGNPCPASVAEALVNACVDLVAQGAQLHELTVRSIVQRAGVSISAVSYHFGSLETLIAVAAQRVYARINLRRVELYQQAVERARPEPPPLRAILDALIRPTVGDQSEIRFLARLGSVLASGPRKAQLAKLENELTPHQIIIDSLHRHAPWFSRAEIGLRVHAILGIRTHIQRRDARMRLLSDHRLTLDDPELIISVIVDLAVAILARPDPANVPTVRF